MYVPKIINENTTLYITFKKKKKKNFNSGNLLRINIYCIKTLQPYPFYKNSFIMLFTS